ncbi:AI-2E family transporter [Priestia koreensis]|uniref:AI-2E family transporter n=1 Tax=Priestia koreensis TaxID=284581 RepID=A0A0M0KVZ1_9BACI|nr:AI-2E family transporter [Priestia koreensis]KOO42974.1 hypothetical protein AMD01_17740 [Priestia koreensis]
MSIFRNLTQNKGFIRILTLVLLVFILFLIRSLLHLVLFTFLLTFLMGKLQQFITRHLRKFVPISPSVVVLALYILIIFAFGLTIYLYIPVINTQIHELVSHIMKFYKNPPTNPVVTFIVDGSKKIVSPEDIQKNLDFVYQYLTNIWTISLQVLLAILLSLFFLLEKSRIINFTSKFKHSKLGWFFSEVEYFGQKFIGSFGAVIEVQFLIALINSILSVIALWILGFPQLVGLGIMIFLLGLIPVAGVFVSLIPLCTIAYTIGGPIKVVSVLVMIAVLHALESYVLNPKLMSAKTNLPIFYTFIILIFSEHFLGIWGLILGVPIFMFFLDLLGVKRKE